MLLTGCIRYEEKRCSKSLGGEGLYKSKNKPSRGNFKTGSQVLGQVRQNFKGGKKKVLGTLITFMSKRWGEGNAEGLMSTICRLIPKLLGTETLRMFLFNMGQNAKKDEEPRRGGGGGEAQ